MSIKHKALEAIRRLNSHAASSAPKLEHCVQPSQDDEKLKCKMNLAIPLSFPDHRDGLWEPAELISSDQSGHRLMNCETGVAFYVGCDGIAESAYATDSEHESEV